MKKLLIVILCLFMASGCAKKVEPVVDPTVDPAPEGDTTCKIDKHEKTASDNVYFEKLKNFKVREKDPSKTVDNEEFNAFLDRVFKNSVETSYLYMHNSVVDYKSLGLEKPEPKWGDIKYNDPDNEDALKELEELLSFDYNSLSYNQQYSYDLFEYSLYESLANFEYSKYSFLYGSQSDSLSGMISSLTDFVFHDEDEVKDYLTLLKDTKRHIADIKQFTIDQMADNIYMSDEMANNSLEFLGRFLSRESDNSLITSFNERINTLDFLSNEVKEDYKKQNSEIVLNDILPEFKDTNEFLKGLLGSLEDPNCLVLHNIDKNYAELTYILNGSYNLNIDEIYERTTDLYFDLLYKYVGAYQEGFYDEVDQYVKDSKGVFGYNNARDILDYLNFNLTSYYPDLGHVEYDVAEMDASSATAGALAYYWPAPLDNLNQNVIRTNPNNMRDDIRQTYTTLAHEGFPGHLYQHVYFQKTNPHRFRNTQSFIGYTEGYAVRAQVDALHFGNFAENPSEEALDIMTFDSIYYFLLYSILDMGINYYGWDEAKLSEELGELGLDPNAASFFVEFLTDNPGVYCPYGLGYTYLTDFRNEAMEALGDKFDIVEFNKVILDCGESPFPLVKQVVDEYIASKK